jgi:hypothetical protein
MNPITNYLSKDIEFKPFDFNIVAPDTMPELKHAQALLRETNKHFQLNETLGQLMQYPPVSLSNTIKQIPLDRPKEKFETYI